VQTVRSLLFNMCKRSEGGNEERCVPRTTLLLIGYLWDNRNCSFSSCEWGLKLCECESTRVTEEFKWRNAKMIEQVIANIKDSEDHNDDNNHRLKIR
jgi:hypothetical protein